MKTYLTATALILLFSCAPKDKKTAEQQPAAADTATKPAPPPEPSPKITYAFMKKKEWQSLKDSFEGAKHLDILNAINRTDSMHITRLDSILVPSDYTLPLTDYLSFPTQLDILSGIRKIILFSLEAQVFAAYENGKLVLTGQTNSGRKSKPTPARLYFANWKSKKSVSTVDDEWILKWNFNIHNTMGIGFHQYALPGYPASHSCLRLQQSDAMQLYSWTEQWILKNNQLAAAGTPVLVFGAYPFGEPRPWFRLITDPEALKIPADSVKKYIAPYLEEIKEKQNTRDSVLNSLSK